MAILIYYRQIRDDPNEAEYWFGASTTDLSRTLIIDKTEKTATTDGERDGMFRTAAGRIMVRATREKVWPTHGVIAS
ncbi:hypothetical protein [Nocardia jejuensis]|uniref:hypothetical protein n=1 Tax=Nocardia jejuensis TaxID=328049 RepID=UPI00082B06FE|nr:hypothetical protein [Nocardia jejuensis]